MVSGIETQKLAFKFHNLGNWIPILKWDTSMSLWLNSLIYYIKMYLFKEGLNFYPFSCSIFLYFQWFPEQEPKTKLPNSITWVIGSRS